MSLYESIIVDIKDNLSISVCGHNGTYNYLKNLKYNIGQWETTEVQLKKIYTPIVKHMMLMNGKTVFVTKTNICVADEKDIIQSIDISN